VLFNIFINDLMDGLEDVSGVVVPTGPMKDCMARATIKVAGALFADDAVGLSPTIPAAIKFCDRVTEWCGINEMQAGIKKCGIMEFRANLAAAPILTEDHPLRAALHLSGEALPLVTEYKYLGLGITPRLLVCDLVKTRLKLGAISVHQLLPFLTSSVLPVSMRWQVVRAVILPRLLYGAEVYGMNRELTNSMQTLLNKALKGIVQIKSARSTVPSAPLWAEFGIQPICALAAGRRARAYRKCFQLKTHIGQIIKEPLRSRCWTWSNGTGRWINRFCKKFFDRVATGVGVDATDWTVLEPIPLRDLIQASITLREQSIRREDPDRTTARATVTYFQGGYGGYQALTKGRVFCKPVDHRGIGLVLCCRIGSYPLVPLLVEVKRLPPYWRNKCPFCGRNAPETLHHLFFICSAWSRQRRKSGIMGTIVAINTLKVRLVAARAANQVAFDSLGISALSNEALAVSWILGGMHDRVWGVKGYMPRPPSSQQAEDPPPGGASSSSSDEGPAAPWGQLHRDARRAHLLRVGTFLILIAPLRGRRLSPLTVPPTQRLRGGGDGSGAPTTTTGQSLVR
jgi:hypothetical protein